MSDVIDSTLERRRVLQVRDVIAPVSVAVIISVLGYGFMTYVNQKIADERAKINEQRFLEFKLEVGDQLKNVNSNLKALSDVLQGVNGNSIRIDNLERNQAQLSRRVDELR